MQMLEGTIGYFCFGLCMTTPKRYADVINQIHKHFVILTIQKFISVEVDS